MEKLAKVLYGWLLDGTESYSTYFINPGANFQMCGWLLCLVIMLVVALLATAIYYYVVASKVKDATIANYIWTYAFGYIVLFFFTPLIFQLAFRGDGCNIWEFALLFVYIGLMNIIYYTVVFQVLSSIFSNTPWTKARNITLFTIFK